MPNGSTADVAFFGGFIVFSIIGARHQDQRKLLEGDRFREFCNATSFSPFIGSGTLRGIRELSPLVIALGVGLTVVARCFHSSWFGG